MANKFDTIFSEDGMAGEAVAAEAPEAPEEQESQGKEAGLRRLRHRLLGLAVIVLAALVFIPPHFQADLRYARHGARMDIPQTLEPGAVKTPIVRGEAAPQTELAVRESTLGPQGSTVSGAQPVKAASRPGLVFSPETDAEREAEKKAEAQDGPQAQPASKPAAKPDAGPEARAPAQARPRAEADAKADAKAQAPAKLSPGDALYIQTGAWGNEAKAREQAKRLKALGLPAYVVKAPSGGAVLWRVRAGKFKTYAQAEKARGVLELNSIQNLGISVEPKAGAKGGSR